VSKRSRRGAPDTSRAGTGSGAGPSASGNRPTNTSGGSSARPVGSAGTAGSSSGSASGTGAAAGASTGAGAAVPAGARVTRPVVQGQVPGAFGSRRTGGSSSPTGTPRAGRRAHPVAQDRSFLERFRTQLIWGGILLGVVVIAAFVLVSASQPAYACSIQLDPASAAPGASVTGQAEDDMTRSHVAVGTPVTYTFCPPASGKHYNASGEGPIAPRFYGPDDTAIPEGWVHNLEHGGLVILYNCSRNGCDTDSLNQLKALATNFPKSPRCNIAGGLISPVIARFDQMKAPFAAVVWDRVLFQDKLDTGQMLEFFKNVGETTNPEQQCNPNASGSPVVSGNPASPDATNPVVNPAGTPSAAASESSSAAAPSSAASAPAASAAPSST